MTFDVEKAAGLYRDLIQQVGEDVERDGLLSTPERAAKALQFLTRGYHQSLDEVVNGAVFETTNDQMVIVRGIEVYSMCEHHMLPFFGKAHVAYIPDGHIVGLSKIPRIVDAYGRRLQVRERLTSQIKDCINDTLKPKGVAVVMEARHMCMQMRGVEKQNSVTTTSAFSGLFLNSEKTRKEFVHLIGSKLH